MVSKSRVKARAKARAKNRARDKARGIVSNPHAIENKELFHSMVERARSGASGIHANKASRRARTRQDAKKVAIRQEW